MRLRQRPNSMTDRQPDKGAHRPRSTGRMSASDLVAVHAPEGRNTYIQYSCPTCGSQNTQRLSTAYMSGLSQFSAVTSGIGWARAPVIGGGWTTGTSQTQLSARLLHHRPRKVIGTALFLLFLAPFIGPAPFAILERIYGVTPDLRTSGRCFWHFAGDRRFRLADLDVHFQ